MAAFLNFDCHKRDKSSDDRPCQPIAPTPGEMAVLVSTLELRLKRMEILQEASRVQARTYEDTLEQFRQELYAPSQQNTTHLDKPPVFLTGPAEHLQQAAYERAPSPNPMVVHGNLGGTAYAPSSIPSPAPILTLEAINHMFGVSFTHLLENPGQEPLKSLIEHIQQRIEVRLMKNVLIQDLKQECSKSCLELVQQTQQKVEQRLGEGEGAQQRLEERLNALMASVESIKENVSQLNDAKEVPLIESKVSSPADLEPPSHCSVCDLSSARDKQQDIDLNLNHSINRTDLNSGVQAIILKDDISERSVAKELASSSYVLQQSMWDCCVILGFTNVGVVDSLIVGAAALLNVCLQMVLCLITCGNLIEGDIDEDAVAAAKHWRAVVGHDFQYADPITQASLVSQICGNNIGLHWSSTQFELSGDLNQYLNPSVESLRSLNGWLLCNCALLLFYWFLFSDVRSNIHFGCSVWSHPRGRPVIAIKDGLCSVTSFSFMQVCLVTLLSVLPRVAVEGMLLFSGSAFLAHTGNIGDLLLNAMALTFILDIDEITFDVLVTMDVKSFFEKLEPINFEPNVGQQIASLRPLVLLGTLLPVLGLAVVNFGVLLPFRRNVLDTFKWLCEGDLDFVYTTNKAAGVVYWTAAQPFDSEKPSAYVDRQVALLTEVDGASKSSAYALRREQWSSIETLFREGMRASSRQLQCMDHLNQSDVLFRYEVDTLYFAMLDLMRDLTSNSSLESCSDVPWEFCFNYSRARAACAHSCGCHSPWSGLVFATESHGCPTSCDGEWRNYLLERDFAPTPQNPWSRPDAVAPFLKRCSDATTTSLINMTSWNRYLYGLRGLAQSLLGTKKAQDLIDDLLQNGCKPVTLIAELEFPICTVGFGSIGRSIRPWCPDSCNCLWLGIFDRSECPTGCISDPRRWHI